MKAISIAAIGIVTAIVVGVAFFGTSTGYGGMSLRYIETPSKETKQDAHKWIAQYFEEQGFTRVSNTQIPEKIFHNYLKITKSDISNLNSVVDFEYQIPFSRPLSIKVFETDKDDGFYVFLYRLNPPWSSFFIERKHGAVRSSLLQDWNAYLRKAQQGAAANP